MKSFNDGIVVVSIFDVEECHRRFSIRTNKDGVLAAANRRDNRRICLESIFSPLIEIDAQS
jgi:hypothetical protein